ncbi:MAG TPA: protein-methionine-sulfoxide reductase heme-binding subunit MsrQ [Vicinamibacterales bacterium]|nr:protein-methionine-sulfoxide reductase heme-binding subunit MsrQ [Vicinamibacterales bacterium]
MTTTTRRIAKTALFLLALVPVAWLAWGIVQGTLGVNPAETIQLQTGLWTLRFLLVTLAVTPVRRLTGWNTVVQFRRMVGLFAFFYATLHFSAYFAFDLNFAIETMVTDVIKRPFILLGFAAFLLMIPLALTSTRGWIRRLGRRWQALHRLIYASAILGVLHFIWKVKVIIGEPVVYAAILAALLGIRVAWTARKRVAARRRAISNAAA